MDDRPKFTQIELRSGLVLLPPGYTPSTVARDGGKKNRGTAGEADAAQGGLGFPEVPPGFEKCMVLDTSRRDDHWAMDRVFVLQNWLTEVDVVMQICARSNM
uniref:Uncharacterized protein n=1 Tax=Oryza sativa subsp. japonica TaxID=39947 RepID=Q6ZCX0_ORYSJ|nr:hypothetical protein [Oryza sativa Japonica Group]BAC99535.1 hypothetical protein [Oryza sativa Japonica Group]